MLLCGPREARPALRTQKNAQGRIWFQPPLFNQGHDVVSRLKGRAPLALSNHVAGFVSRASGTAPLSMMTLRPAGVKMNSMNASADFVTVVSR